MRSYYWCLWIVTCAFNTLSSSGQTIGSTAFAGLRSRMQLDLLVYQMARHNQVDHEIVGYGAKESEQYKRFEQLQQLASTEELITLVKHESLAVKVYAFWALSQREGVNLATIVMEHLADTREVETQIGCMGYREKVGDVFVRLGLHSFSREQTRVLINKMIYEEYPIAFRSVVIRSLPAEAQYYNRIRELAVQNEADALMKLAQYKKAEDVGLIRERLSDKKFASQALIAIAQFPDSAFLPLLKDMQVKMLRMRKRFDYAQIRYLYQAVVQYRNQESRNMMEYALKHGKGFAREKHAEAMWLVLRKHPDDYYQKVLAKIRLNKVQQGLLQTLEQ